MRVVGGNAKGRSLKSVPGQTTRPILDRVKTALFDTLRPEIAGVRMLDLFAGTGAVGIEALSQGADQVVFVDLEKKAIETIKENLQVTNLRTKAQIRHQDAFTYLRNTDYTFDIVYIAPPQYKALWVKALHQIAERPEIVNEGGLLIVQIDPKEYEDKHTWLDRYYPMIKERLLTDDNIPKFETIIGYCQQHGISLQDVLFVDDSLKHVFAAERHGISSWHISSFLDWNSANKV